MATAVTIRSLRQNLLPIRVENGVFVTIYFWVFLAISLVYRYWGSRYGSVARRRIWPEFRSLKVGSMLLTFWYLMAVIDRWIRFVQHYVLYGYILVGPLWEFFRIGSSLLMLWGNFKLIWKEFALRHEITGRYWWLNWWFGAKLFFMVDLLVSAFYCMLCVASAGVWLNSFSLNAIADIETKRIAFEVALAALLFGFSLYTTVVAAITYKGTRRQDGQVTRGRTSLYAATLLLLARFVIEFIISVYGYHRKASPQSLLLARDVSFGLVTGLFLILMLVFAHRVSGDDLGGGEATRVQAWLRHCILRELDEETRKGRAPAPPFDEIISRAEDHLKEQTRFGALGSPNPVTALAGREFINNLKREYSHLRQPQWSASRRSRITSVVQRDNSRREIGSITTEAPVQPPYNRFAMYGQWTPQQPYMNGNTVRHTHREM